MKNKMKYIMAVLKLMEKYDDYDSIWWRTDVMQLCGKVVDYRPITFIVNCNDVFHLACSDAERISGMSDVNGLRRAYEECSAAHRYGECYAPELWVSRKRNQMPCKEYLESVPVEIMPLFEAVEVRT